MKPEGRVVVGLAELTGNVRLGLSVAVDVELDSSDELP